MLESILRLMDNHVTANLHQYLYTIIWVFFFKHVSESYGVILTKVTPNGTKTVCSIDETVIM